MEIAQGNPPAHAQHITDNNTCWRTHLAFIRSVRQKLSLQCAHNRQTEWNAQWQHLMLPKESSVCSMLLRRVANVYRVNGCHPCLHEYEHNRSKTYKKQTKQVKQTTATIIIILPFASASRLGDLVNRALRDILCMLWSPCLVQFAVWERLKTTRLYANALYTTCFMLTLYYDTGFIIAFACNWIHFILSIQFSAYI